MDNYSYPTIVSQSTTEARGDFIRKTYTHLAFAILAFAFLEYMLLQAPFAVQLAATMTRGFTWLLVLGAFMFVSHFAHRWALSSTSKQTQYMALGIFTIAEAIIFLPLLLIASHFAPDAISSAAVLTLIMFIGLTYIAFTSGKDFTFLGGFLRLGGFIAIGLIVASFIFGFSLGIIFSGVMILFASAAILYETSSIIRHYNTEQYVAASLALFASVALLFWYILQFLMQFAGD